MSDILDSSLVKYRDLVAGLSSMKKAAVAFSGGTDSSLLAYAARESMGKNAVAVTVASGVYTRAEIEEAIKFSEHHSIEHVILNYDILKNAAFRSNPPDRCYHCKLEVFKKIIGYAASEDIKEVMEGSNRDDLEDYRPGVRALNELGIRSPLKEMDFSKAEIREVSKHLGLETWDRPPSPCLATRFPYGTEITVEKLKMVDESERYIRQLGFRNVRVRLESDTARIEVDPENIALLAEKNTSKKIARKLKSLGFLYVSLDLEGYRMGSMNASISGNG